MLHYTSTIAGILLGSLQLATGHDIQLERTELSTKLPTPLSDLTATTVGDSIYIAGGCDDPNGNTWIEEWGFFSCGSISSGFYQFDTATESFITLPDLPRARYRHATVAVGNQLWLVGGRTLEDALIEEVDVYDTTTQEWTTYTLPAGYAASDHAGFGTETHAYFAGGYVDGNYTATDRVYSIDVEASMNGGNLVIVDNANMITERGDIAAAVNLGTGYAYISGGFTHENLYCEPLETVERYSLPPGDSWINVAKLPTPRADKSMVIFKEHAVIMGGETQHEDKCDADHGPISPGDLTVTVDDVEVLDDDDSTWHILATLPEHRFRFMAAVHGDTIYTFGGQQAYDADCKCLKTTDEVAKFEDIGSGEETISGEGSSMMNEGIEHDENDPDHDHGDHKGMVESDAGEFEQTSASATLKVGLAANLFILVVLAIGFKGF